MTLRRTLLLQAILVFGTACASTKSPLTPTLIVAARVPTLTATLAPPLVPQPSTTATPRPATPSWTPTLTLTPTSAHPITPFPTEDFVPYSQLQLITVSNLTRITQVAELRLPELSSDTFSFYDLLCAQDGKTLAVISISGQIYFYNLERLQRVQMIDIGPEFYGTALSPDGQILAVGYYGDIVLWDVNTGQKLKTLKGHTEEVGSLEFSPDRRWLVSANVFADSTIRLWDVGTGKNIYWVVASQTQGVVKVRFSPDGLSFAAVGRDGTLQLWDTKTGKPISAFRDEDFFLSAVDVVFNPNGKTFISISRNRNDDHQGTLVLLWDIATGQRLLEYESLKNANSIAFSPDGNMIVSTSEGVVSIWAADTGQLLHAIRLADSGIAATFNSDGRTIITSGLDNVVRFWGVPSS